MVIEATDVTFTDEVLNSKVPVVVDFWAPWCGPCKMIAPIFEDLSNEFGDTVKFVKVNVDETEIAQKYGIRGIPTFLLFKNGAHVKSKTGAMNKQTLQAFISE